MMTKFGHWALAALLASFACQQDNSLPPVNSGKRIVVAITGGVLGTAGAPQPINFNPSNAYTLHLEMHDRDDQLDTSFNGYVRVTSKPGTVYSVNGGQDGRNVQLVNGVADNVAVTVVAAFGETRIWAQDVGFTPVGNLLRVPPPACANGKDDDNDGLVDYPADPGCFSVNDDDETSGTGATGVSGVIYYALPRIADVRGATTTSGTGTPFPNEQVNIDTGYNLATNKFAWDTVVTGLASDGFFTTDVQDQTARGYASIFAFTFSAPTKIGVCDRLRLLQGTSADFFGYTELNFPTWAVEYWDPNQRPCLVPDPIVLAPTDWTNAGLMFKNESGLVRVQTAGAVTLHVGAHIGPGRPVGPGYVPGCDATGCATNCDLNASGKVDFGDANEAACANACTADPECTEFSSYASQGGFSIVVTDGTSTAKAQGNATAATRFDPVTNAGKPIGAFSGMLRYFSGGSQFTIQARCDDDVIVAGGTPLDSSHACVNQNGNNPEQQN